MPDVVLKLGTLTALLYSIGNAAIENVVVTSGASFELGLPAKGSIAAIFCTGLEGIEGVVAAKEMPLPRELAGVRVTVGGASAPIFAIAALGGYQQINIQVPQEARITITGNYPVWPVSDTVAQTDLVVEQGNQRARVEVIVRKSPGDFFELEGGFAILQHASDYSLVTPENPARPDEVLIAYLTGMPGTRPVVPTGVASPSSPPAVVPQDPVLLIDTYNVTIRITTGTIDVIHPDFVGLAPGLVGVYQMNLKLPNQSILFIGRPMAPFVTELSLFRSYCPSGNDCHPTTIPRFLSKYVKIPIAPKLP
jgi:uncharacterized protein (TIGR03437 family)